MITIMFIVSYFHVKLNMALLINFDMSPWQLYAKNCGQLNLPHE